MSLNPLIDKAVINSSEEADDLECSARHLLNIDAINRIQGDILNLEKAQRMAEFFSFLGDANRLRILSALAMKELCVHELAAAVNMSESAVSHQLRNLRAIRLVSYRKQGRKVFYRLQDTHVFSLYQAVAEHLDEAED